MKLNIHLPDNPLQIEIEIDKDQIIWEYNKSLDVYAAAGIVAKIADMFPNYAVRLFTYNHSSTFASIKAVLKNIHN